MSREIDTLHVTRTYGGFLEGTHEMANRHLRALVPRNAERLFGPRPLLVVWPETDPTEPWPDHNDGRQLVVVWFSELPVDEVLYDLNEVLTDELWAAHAEEYQI